MLRFLLAILLFLAGLVPVKAELKVIASIMPVHSIVASVMDDRGRPELLLSGQLSEHAASFTPAQIASLGRADLVFMVGRGLESSLARLSGSEAVNGKTFIELAAAPGIKLLRVRDGGAWDADAHEHESIGDAPHREGMVRTVDPHVWLNPENAKAMAEAAAAALSKADPGNAQVYSANARDFAAEVDATSEKISAAIAGVRHKPFIVFHDAYQYFEDHFGLQAAGSISDVSAASPSAARLKEVRDRLKATGAACVFREPQFDDKFVSTVIEGTPTRAGVLDGLGADLAEGPEAYHSILLDLAASLKSCLEN